MNEDKKIWFDGCELASSDMNRLEAKLDESRMGVTGGVARYGQKSDVGLNNVDNVKQYSASNPPPAAGVATTKASATRGTVKLVVSEKTLDIRTD